MTGIHASFILEILGRPAEHVTESLKLLQDRLATEKGVKIINKKIHEPRQIENTADLFTSFAEIEAEFESLDALFRIMFAYLPSNVEIVHPEKVSISNSELSDISSKIVQRLHEYDAIAKNVLIEREAFLKEIKNSAPDVFQKLASKKEKLLL